MIRPVAADGRIETGGAFTPIHRSRVVERIESAATQRIVLIVAPAGYGKSVALRQYLDTVDELEQARYDVRAENATLLGFVRGFADALSRVAPDARKTVSGAYEKSLSSKTPGIDLAMWMHAHLKAFTGLVAIDDLHIAENDPEISKFLISLIERTKGRTRWIIASRSSLDLPVGSWLAYGEMDLNIDEQDLRFTIEEARHTAKASRVSVRDEELHEILSMTEGWPTALSFALRSSTRSVDLRNIAASTREMVYRYLAEQVYESLEDDERDLLQFISYLHEIDLNVLRRAGYTKAKAVVESLRDRVAFIYPDRPNVYRCHDLFRDFLQHQLELQGDRAVEAMRLRVAQALEDTGSIAAALEVYSSVPSESHVLRLLEEHGFSLMERAHGDAVSLAVEALSHESRAVDPVILGLRAMREAHNGRLDRAESLLQRALQRSTSAELTGELVVRLGVILFAQNRDVIELLEPHLKHGLPVATHAKVLSLLTPAYAYAGRTEEAKAALIEAEHYTKTIESDEVRAQLVHRMGMAALALSLPFEKVIGYYLQAERLASEKSLFNTSAAALGGASVTSLLYEDDVSKYVWYAQQMANAAAKAGDRLSMQTALIQMINAEARRGNLDRVLALEQQFAAVTTSDTSRLFYVVPARAMMAAWQGNFEEAYRQMSTIADRSFYNFDRVFNMAMQSLYAISAGARERAGDLAATVVAELEQQNFDQYLYGRRSAELARFICAITEGLSGRISKAQRLLSRRTGDDEGPIGAVRDAASAVCRMCKNPALALEVSEANEQLRAVGYGGIARVLERVLERYASEQTNVEVPLTKAEIEVLHLLASGHSPKDIALETGRSVYTIQAHIQNAIRKLGCSGRTEALGIARRRGLLA